MMHGVGVEEEEEEHGVQQQHHQPQQLAVPPGFRFHPTDEELLYYYLKKKVSYEAIDLDVIREVDLNKLEPWDLKEKCRIGTGPQNEWYFFSHKDKKYPTGTRTNRATAAGFWKATGRDKAIYLSNAAKRIGMRKTLVFYTGRAPHGQKTDWIMHEYRLDDDSTTQELQEDGWVVCRVFKKKNHIAIPRGYQVDIEQDEVRDHHHQDYNTPPHHHYPKPSHTTIASGSVTATDPLIFTPHQFIYGGSGAAAAGGRYTTSSLIIDGSMNLPQLSSPDSTTIPNVSPSLVPPPPSLLGPLMSLNTTIDHSSATNLLRLNSDGGPPIRSSTGLIHHPVVAHEQHQRFTGGDWSFLDKLLTNYQTLDHHHQQSRNQHLPEHHHHHVDDQGLAAAAAASKFPFQYLGNDAC